jgi:hypothetical protein
VVAQATVALTGAGEGALTVFELTAKFIALQFESKYA